ncbi:hypothetical protein FOCC_FOCC004274 [Frankliniella occidentalis]|nr:hypothetical protein FOCC_FOCC004274 [Frankliniella occidentalis]
MEMSGFRTYSGRGGRGVFGGAGHHEAYFALTLLIMAVFLHEERQYLAGQEGNNTEPYEPVLETETITTSTMVFNVMVTVCSVLGLVSSALLVYGVYRDMKQLLVPWIAVVVMASIVDVAHVVYLIYIESKNFNPMTTIVFTLDFFLISFNIYSLLCVVSQYQEYRAGRGTAHQHRQFPAAAQVRYVSKPDLWPEGRGRTRGLSLVPTPTGPANGPGFGAMGDHPPLTLVSPAHCSPSTCLLDAAQGQLVAGKRQKLVCDV